MTTNDSLHNLSDDQLVARVQALAGDERRATVALIFSLVEFDARRLYLREGYSSLFTYCTQVLHLSEHAAYGRIEAARAARRFPVLLGLLREGPLTLTTICLLAPHLTEENHERVLAAARYKTKRDVELLVATLRPQPAVPAVVRSCRKPKRRRSNQLCPGLPIFSCQLSNRREQLSTDRPFLRSSRRSPQTGTSCR